MVTESTGQHRGGDVSVGRPALVHHVVARRGEVGSEVLCVSLEGRGETLPVFSAGWAARGYLFAEAPGGDGALGGATPPSCSPCLTGPAPSSSGWRSTPGRAAAGVRRRT